VSLCVISNLKNKEAKTRKGCKSQIEEGIPLTVIFPRAAREPAGTNPCGPLPKKSLDAHDLEHKCIDLLVLIVRVR
jgi:hypothetical protein